MPLSISCESSTNLRKSQLFVGQKSTKTTTSSKVSIRPIASLNGRDSLKNNLPVDKRVSKMTTLEEMEKREKEIKTMLENAESLEERKQLRTELRELRRKIFEAPTTTKTSISVTTKKELSNTEVNIEKENTKNLDLNGNKRISVTLNTSKPTPITIETKIKADTTLEQETEKPRTTSSESSTTSSNNMSSSVARRSRLFQTDDNNNASKTESSAPQTNGIKLKINDGGDDTPTLRTRDPADRAARGAGRAQQQREMSVDQGNTETNKEEAPKPTETVIVEAPKEEKKEEPKTTTEQRKSTSTLSVGGTGTKNTGSAGLRRTATWGAKDKNGAANNIGKALNKFGPQSNSSSTTKRPVSSYGGGGRFANLSADPVPPPQPKPEPPKQNGTPSFGNPTGTQSAADRMAYFRQAAEAEKKKVEEKKAAAEARQKQQEMLNAVINGEVSMGSTKKEEEEKTPATRKESNEGGAKKGGSSAPCKRREKKKVTRRTMSIGSIVLDWVQEMIKDYPVEVTNFSSSWNNGMAFCALIHAFNKDEFDFSELKPENKHYNFDLAFDTGYKVKKIPKLLDTDDMVAMARPEPRSVQTYIQWIWSVYGPTSGYGPTPQEVQK